MTRGIWFSTLAAATLIPDAAASHDAFGDLGPFYANLLHPLADTGQGILLAAIAILLARQPLETVRPAYAALVIAGAATVLGGVFLTYEPFGPRVTGLVVAILGVAAMVGIPLGPILTTGIAVFVAISSGFAMDISADTRILLSAIGGTLGIALGALLIWGLIDTACHRFGPIVGAVAGSWVAAIGIMAAALP